MDFESFIEQYKPASRKRLAVAAAEDDVVLRAVKDAYDMGLATATLFGDRDRIERIAASLSMDLTPFDIAPTATQRESAQRAAELVREGGADILMKGLLQTADVMRAVLDRERGIRGPGVLSHVCILQSPILEKTLFLTDAAVCIAPDLKMKAEMIRNAVTVAKGMGVEKPLVAPLAPVELVNPSMQATVDAAALTLMNHRGQIEGCVVDGPLALDLALSPEAARHKGVDSEVAGNADILLCHNIDAANNTMKCFILAGNCLSGGLLMGATAPIVMTSRSDTYRTKLCSIACATKMS